MRSLADLTWNPKETEIVRDMRTTARELGVLALLTEALSALGVAKVDEAVPLITAALLRLGATPDELQRLQNLRAGEFS